VKKLLLLLLLPSLLFGAGDKVTIQTGKNIEQKVKEIRRVSLGSPNKIVFEQDSLNSKRYRTIVGANELNYKDSTGKYTPFNFDLKSTGKNGKGEYDKVVEAGPFLVEFSTATPGKMKYTRKGKWVEFIPAHDTTGIDVQFKVNQHGVKETITLRDATASKRLVWGVNTNGKNDLKKNGKEQKVKAAGGGQAFEIPAFTAWDANGDSIPLAVSYDKDDSLIVQVNPKAGAVYPFYVDPSVIDSVIKGAAVASAQLTQLQASYTLSRDSVVARAANSASYSNAANLAIGRASTTQNYRVALSFGLEEHPAGTTLAAVDSVRLYVYNDGSFPTTGGDSVIIRAAQGTFAGGLWNVFWYNDFIGWAASGAYTVATFDSLVNGLAGLKQLESEGAGWKSALFNQAGIDSVKSKMGRDTLRVMLLAQADIGNGTPAIPANYFWEGVAANPNPYLEIFYRTGFPPGITTLADTLKSAAVFVGQVDSTGGINLSSRGVKLWPKGATLAGDTITASSVGTFGTGVFAIYVDSLYSDTLYRYKMFGTNVNGTVYGGMDSIQTTAGSGTTVIVDGRVVSTVK